MLAAAGCDLNGNELIYPGASIYEAPDRGFHFFYLSPPWRSQVPEEGHLLYLVVDSFGAEHTITHKLWVGYSEISSKPRLAAELMRNDALKMGRSITTGVSEFETQSGDTGFEFTAFHDEATGRFYYRDALFLDVHGKLVLFQLVAVDPLDDPDIDDLILSFATGPNPGTHPTPSPKKSATSWDLDGGAP